jgi:protein-S-isoprenylcysteine O-methyltransferase Ste14
LPPAVLLISILLTLVLYFVFPRTQFVVGPWRLLGILPLGFGLAISYGSEKQFRQAGTTLKPFDETSRLVTDGFYRFSRNPMYLGMAMILVGVAFLLGSLLSFGMIVFFVVWIYIIFIRNEEEMMLTQYGQDWLEYKERVRCWF